MTTSLTNNQQLTVFDYQSSQVRTVMIEGEPWFVAKDVCDILGHTNNRIAIEGLEPNEKGVSKVYTLGGEQSMQIVSESGLYQLIFRSNLPKAKEFSRWVTGEVLPSIRKTGQYGIQSLTRLQIAEMLVESEKRALALEGQVQEMLPKAKFADDFQAAVGNILIREMAKKLDTGEKRLFDYLIRNKILISRNEPYQRYKDAGYFKIKSGTHSQKDKLVEHHTVTVTPKGQYWLWKRWNNIADQPGLILA